MHASFVIGFLVENLDGVWDVRCYGAQVDMLGRSVALRFDGVGFPLWYGFVSNWRCS